MTTSYTRLGTGDNIVQDFADFASFPPPTGSGKQAWDTATQTMYYDEPDSGMWVVVGGAGGGFITSVSDTNTVDLTVAGSDLTADVTFQDTNSIDMGDDISGLKADLKLSAASATAGNFKATTTIEADGIKTEVPDRFLNTDKVTLVAGDITNKYIVLSEAPADKPQTQLTVIGGPEQEYSVDFEVTTDNADRRLSWNGLGLDGILIAGDRIIVNYN